jgi:SSS family solute:Na+ symporter
MFTVSLFRPHKHTEESQKLVWKHPLAALEFKGWSGLANYKFLAVALFVIMVALYIIFSSETTMRLFHLIK